jgi:subtilase family serine protease
MRFRPVGIVAGLALLAATAFGAGAPAVGRPGRGDVISQSFGATEETFPDARTLLRLRSALKNAAAHHVTVLGSSGDAGPTDFQLNLQDLFTHRVNSWPSSDPLVTSIGGTQLHLDAQGNAPRPTTSGTTRSCSGPRPPAAAACRRSSTGPASSRRCAPPSASGAAPRTSA